MRREKDLPEGIDGDTGAGGTGAGELGSKRGLVAADSKENVLARNIVGLADGVVVCELSSVVVGFAQVNAAAKVRHGDCAFEFTNGLW